MRLQNTVQMIEEIGGAKLKKSDFIGINECFKPIEREYKRGEIITTYSPENDTICIIKEIGRASCRERV